MLRFLFKTILILTLAASNLLAQTDQAPVFAFKESKHDFGDIEAGKTVEHQFEFTNTGKSPLIISKILTTCGCTAPSWPEEPINPGEKGKIKIVFNSSGKIGRQNKIITILSNAVNQKERLHIMANVIPDSGS